MLTLMTGDGQEFVVEQSVAIQSITINKIVEEENCASSVIPLPNVNSKTMAKIVEYLKKYADESASKDDVDEFNDLKLGEFIMAAKYLNIPGLIDKFCQRYADWIKNKSVEKVREIFRVENNFTPEEEAQLRQE
ncbi:hypothetical protein ACH5RR_016327 [Cinchona calisaya]|uniref:SKP1-like protein n=1 Tax=Cinchona calisaya TaxID=153742 RepID=A0ABD2ZWU6_9GENT